MNYNKQHILFISTSFAEYDRRMQRIVQSLINANFKVSWIARTKKFPVKIEGLNFIRLETKAKSGFMFYAQFNRQAQKLALQSDAAIVSAVDLDTLMAASWALKKGRKMVFDAHEYFTEVPELKGRNFVKNYWARLGRKYIPRAHKAYTVNQSLAGILSNLYKRKFDIIRNVPNLSQRAERTEETQSRTISYIGVLNMGRGLHQIIDAMAELDARYELQLIGDGDIRASLEKKVDSLGLNDRVHFLGYVKPEEIQSLLASSWCGINLLDSTSLNYYYSLANKYFDYIHAHCPQICMDFPEYQVLNRKHETSILVKNLEPKNIHQAIQKLAEDFVYKRLESNCVEASQEFHWAKEEPKLLAIYKDLVK